MFLIIFCQYLHQDAVEVTTNSTLFLCYKCCRSFCCTCVWYLFLLTLHAFCSVFTDNVSLCLINKESFTDLLDLLNSSVCEDCLIERSHVYYFS